MKYLHSLRVALILFFLVGGRVFGAAGKEIWVEMKSPHFVAYSDASESQTRDVLLQFEEIRNMFLTVFPGIRVDPPKPMILIVTRNSDSMKRFLPGEFEGKNPKKDAGVFFTCQDRNYAILRMDVTHQMDQPYQVLFHEFTHGILHLNFPAMPVWLDEGIADFYGATEIRSDHVMIGKVPWGRLETIRTSSFLPMETLMRVNHSSPHYREGDKSGVFYSQSWVFVHYLFMNEQAQKAELYKKYLTALQKNPDSVAAGRESFGDLDKLLRNLNSYAHQPRFLYWTLKVANKATNRDFRSRTLDVASALLVRGEFFQNTGQEKESRPILEEALTLSPKLPELQVALGYGHFLRNETRPAIAAFEDAIRLGSTDFRPHYYLARLAQVNYLAQGEGSSQTLEHLEQARRLRPDFPGIHMLLCMEYSKDPSKAAEALEAGKLAVELEPQDLTFRANLGLAYMNLNLESQAKTIGDQLNTLARTQQEKFIADQYAVSLSHFIDRRKAQMAHIANNAGGGSTPGSTTPAPVYMPSKSIKFRPSENLVPLWKEVLQLLRKGKTAEAAQKVEAALSKAQTKYDRKALQDLLDQLRVPASTPTPRLGTQTTKVSRRCRRGLIS